MTKIGALIVSNCEGDLQRFSGILSVHDCLVYDAFNYKQAFEIATFGIHDVILIDMAMPDQQGMKLLREIKAHGITAGVIVLDTNGMDDFHEVWQLGISGVLSRNEQGGIMDMENGPEVLYEAVIKASRMHVPVEEVERILGKDPFEITYDEYLKLDSRAIVRLHEKVWGSKDEWTREKLSEKGAQWLILCGNQVVYGDNRQGVLTSKALAAYGKERDRVPFLFMYAPEIEEAKQHLPISTP